MHKRIIASLFLLPTLIILSSITHANDVINFEIGATYTDEKWEHLTQLDTTVTFYIDPLLLGNKPWEETAFIQRAPSIEYKYTEGADESANPFDFNASQLNMRYSRKNRSIIGAITLTRGKEIYPANGFAPRRTLKTDKVLATVGTYLPRTLLFELSYGRIEYPNPWESTGRIRGFAMKKLMLIGQTKAMKFQGSASVESSNFRETALIDFQLGFFFNPRTSLQAVGTLKFYEENFFGSTYNEDQARLGIQLQGFVTEHLAISGTYYELATRSDSASRTSNALNISLTTWF